MAHIHELYDFTVSAFIIHPAEPRLLLLHHNKIGKWLQPGGHIELNEDPLQALQHELLEETGLTPDDYTIIESAERPQPSGNSKVLPLPFYFNVHPFNDLHKHIDICYLAKSKTARLTNNPDGASDIQWLNIDGIRKKYSAGLLFDDTLNVCEWILARYK